MPNKLFDEIPLQGQSMNISGNVASLETTAMFQ